MRTQAADAASVHRSHAAVDALLVLMVVIWGANYSVIKHAFAEVPPQPFNAVRLLLASAVFLVAIAATRWHARGASRPLPDTLHTPAEVTRRDWIDLVWLGLVGHTGYQVCFVAGVDGTSVSNAALIIGATPVVIALVSAALGRERIRLFHWLGAAASAIGLYFVVGHEAEFGGPSLRGDLLIGVSVCCWAIYTLGSTRLVARHSPLFVTGVTMTIGAIPYGLMMAGKIAAVSWTSVSAGTLLSLLLSSLLALNLAYTIWYTGVKQLGPAKTSIFSNLVPVAAMTVASLWLHEPISRAKLIGAGCVLGGVLTTRVPLLFKRT